MYSLSLLCLQKQPFEKLADIVFSVLHRVSTTHMQNLSFIYNYSKHSAECAKNPLIRFKRVADGFNYINAVGAVLASVSSVKYYGCSNSMMDDNKEECGTSKQTRGTVARKAQESELWKEEKEKYLKMPKGEKRKHYRKYVVLNEVPTWTEYYKKNRKRLRELDEKVDKKDVDEELNSKVSIWRGDITTLEIDCIVNAANESLLGGGGVDGAIHRAAGSNLVQECRTLHGCQTGDAKITGGYKLPAKFIIHTVGPIGTGDDHLQSCYKTSLEVMTKNNLRSIAFPCISTGIYGFPVKRAANIALDVTRTYLEKNRDLVDRIIFCLFMESDVKLYEKLMQVYFPASREPETSKNDDSASQRDKAATKEDKHSRSKNTTETKKFDDTPANEKSTTMDDNKKQE